MAEIVSSGASLSVFCGELNWPSTGGACALPTQLNRCFPTCGPTYPARDGRLHGAAARDDRLRWWQRDPPCHHVRAGRNKSGDALGVTWLGFLRWPLAGRVQNTQHAHRVGGHVIDQDVISVCDKFARSDDAARSAKLGMVDPAGRSLG